MFLYIYKCIHTSQKAHYIASQPLNRHFKRRTTFWRATTATTGLQRHIKNYHARGMCQHDLCWLLCKAFTFFSSHAKENNEIHSRAYTRKKHHFVVFIRIIQIAPIIANSEKILWIIEQYLRYTLLLFVTLSFLLCLLNRRTKKSPTS